VFEEVLGGKAVASKALEESIREVWEKTDLPHTDFLKRWDLLTLAVEQGWARAVGDGAFAFDIPPACAECKEPAYFESPEALCPRCWVAWMAGDISTLNEDAAEAERLFRRDMVDEINRIRLAEELVDTNTWEWGEGMAVLYYEGDEWVRHKDRVGSYVPLVGAVPDLTDHATTGVLLSRLTDGRLDIRRILNSPLIAVDYYKRDSRTLRATRRYNLGEALAHVLVLHERWGMSL